MVNRSIAQVTSQRAVKLDVKLYSMAELGGIITIKCTFDVISRINLPQMQCTYECGNINCICHCFFSSLKLYPHAGTL